MKEKVRLSVTVDAELGAAAQRAVADGLVPSVSAWVNDALRRHQEEQSGLAGLREVIAEWEAEGGPFTPEEMDAAEEWVRKNTIQVRPGRRTRRTER